MIGESETEFYAIIDARYVPITAIGAGGEPYTITQEQSVYAMIAKEDYFANRPIYREVVDIV